MQLVVRNLWTKYDWRAPNRLLVVQTGESASQTKVFKAHAVPQGLCENWINALKVLANQQEDGDSPVQSIVTGLCERSRKGNTEGLRRPTFEEGCSEVSIREGPQELTLRAEEVGSQKACINVDHTAEDTWGSPLFDADWHAFCQVIYKGIEGSEWED